MNTKRFMVGTLVGGLTMGVVGYLISGSGGVGMGEMTIIFLVIFAILGVKRMPPPGSWWDSNIRLR